MSQQAEGRDEERQVFRLTNSLFDILSSLHVVPDPESTLVGDPCYGTPQAPRPWEGVECEYDAEGVGDLKAIKLHGNAAEGTLPTQLGQLSLESLVLSSYKLSGTLPTELALTSARKIHMPGCAISGHLPPHWSAQLGGVFLGQNRISGTLPTELGALSGLDAIMVEMNSLSGTVVRTPCCPPCDVLARARARTFAI